MPTSDEDRIHRYEILWQLMELAKKDREERKDGDNKSVLWETFHL